MEEYKFLGSILEISLTVTLLTAIIIYGAKRFEKILENHRHEREKFETDKDALVKELNTQYREEREEMRESLRELDIYARKITQDTYTLIAEFKKQLADMEVTRKLEEDKIAKILKESSMHINAEVVDMLKIIGEHLKINDRKFK